MSHILRMATLGVTLAFAAMQVRAMRRRRQSGRIGSYRGAALSCDLPSSACSNDERIND